MTPCGCLRPARDAGTAVWHVRQQGPQFGNPLKDRFLASEQFTQLYHDAYWQLYDQMYADGRAHALLDEIAATVPVTDGLSATELADKVAAMHSWIDQRTEALAELRES